MWLENVLQAVSIIKEHVSIIKERTRRSTVTKMETGIQLEWVLKWFMLNYDDSYGNLRRAFIDERRR
jgi:hypothetical protein